MNSMRSLVRQAAKPLARNAFAKRTIFSSPASLSDALFVVRRFEDNSNKQYQILIFFF